MWFIVLQASGWFKNSNKTVLLELLEPRLARWKLVDTGLLAGSSYLAWFHKQLPRLTLRHPSVDGTAMPLDGDEPNDDFLAIRSNPRRWTDSESSAPKKALAAQSEQHQNIFYSIRLRLYSSTSYTYRKAPRRQAAVLFNNVMEKALT
ncbi:unnamed protein product [Nippostrongylus brasiliensis]|uniref:Uncharacterized protein n=1 Tax=Nippostrongylus brasiliensis TaxID=27835 RepID=A0A0N4YAT5_NIPBR|nr:unnamed protein product [Nippostrongylus brasiliensis]